jgi:signal transduction histidine kinase
MPICRDAADAIEAAFTEAAVPAEFYYEFLDRGRLGPVQAPVPLSDHLLRKYAGRPPTLLLAYGDEAATLLVRERSALWPDAPIIAFALERPHPDFPPDVAQLQRPEIKYGVAETVAAGLRMVPGARRVVFVGGSGPSDRSGRAIVRDRLATQLPSVPLVEVVGLSMAETLARVRQLPADTIVYSFGIFVDALDQRFVANESLRQIVAASNRPVFAVASHSVGLNIVGGYLTDFGAEARAAAELAVRVATGASPAASAAVPALMATPIFDGRQLGRWGIREADLPPGSTVVHREPSFFEQYAGWVALAAFQTALIAGLLFERRMRRRASLEAEASESLNRSVIASLPGMTAIVDRAGVVLRVNRTWEEHAPGGPAGPLVGQPPRTDCRGVCGGSGRDHPLSARTLLALDAVLGGAAPEAGFDFSAPSGGEVTWFTFKVQRLDRPEGGAVLACEDVTRDKVREFEDRRTLQEVAHASRVTTMGELAASFAHEINQPLAAILSNAHTASTILRSPRPDLDLVREVVDDIANNDRRAGQVIRRMRAMLQKGEQESLPVSLNDIARDVVALLGSEASLRRVSVACEFAAGLPPVNGDPVQLQQVVLNLVVNAIEATSGTEAARRSVVVSTRADGHRVELSVGDAGTGIAPEHLPSIFKPFFTTKPTGLGMGLSITRSILDAHGGVIAAENNEAGGATFRCRLPAATGPAS